MKVKKRYYLKTPEIWPNGNIGAFKRLKWKNKSVLRIRNFALLQWRRMFFQPKAKKKSTKIKAQIPEQDLAIHTIHFPVTSLLHPFTMQEIYNWNLSLDLDIQTQLNFEISNGQQNSFTAEPALVQRRLASTLSWPHYKFKCSEIHRQMNQVHMPVVCISYWAVCNRERFYVYRLPLYLERHVKQMSWHPNF